METESRRHLVTTALPPPSPMSSTTFVQADAATFRELVQKLTGLAPDADAKTHHAPKQAPNHPNTANLINSPRRSSFKLQERRHTIRKLEIKNTSGTSPCSSPCYESSPIASPVTPLIPSCAADSPFFSSTETSPSTEEERAIAEKRFYLHPSPLSTPRGGSDAPELLTLFPLTSPHANN
ncbi:VQ motif-containing protein 11 [Linum perenne]